MERRGKRVLLTGATGFTGGYVRETLVSEGYQVFSIGGQPSTADGLHVQADLRDSHGLRDVVRQVKPEVVVHLAALAFVGHGSPNEFYEVNLVGTRNLLDALVSEQAPVECVLLASSANVYGNSRQEVLDESVPPSPSNDYAVSKVAMEYMASLWRDKLPIILVRPFNYTGVGQAENFLVPKIVAHFQRRASFIELGNLDVWRDFSDVRFVANVYAALLRSPGAIGTTLNVCSGSAHSLGEIIEMCEQITGHQIEVRVNPDFVRANEVRRLQGDDTQLRRWIGGLENPPLRRTLEWMLGA
jgi:GDP-6-deoxy-D-talose 4-dehydrogenase